MKTHLTAIVFSVAIIIAAVILGNAYIERSKPEGTISVTGLGRKDFTSDLIVWEGYFSRESRDLKQASAELNADRNLIQQYLIANGIKNDEVVFNAIEIHEKNRMKYSPDGNYMGEEFEGYRLNQSLQITSKDIDKIEGISRKITELINEGVRFNSTPPRYYFTGLSDLKIELVSHATADARNRAEKIAENSGGDIGDLISAQMGIFQITGQNSNEEFSWGGTYNTTSRDKSASITMKLTYRVK